MTIIAIILAIVALLLVSGWAYRALLRMYKS
jgi:FtsZ-interacting cell division protein ZipA